MSTEYLKTDYEKLAYFVNLLKSRASGKNVSEREYTELREELLSNKILQSVLPTFIKTNGELNSFWRFIKDKFSTYDERTEFLTKEFEPILRMLENSQTSLPALQKYAHTKDSIKQELKEYFISHNVLLNIYGEFTLTDKNIGNGGTSEVKGFEFGGKQYAIKFLLEDVSQKESQAFKRFKQAHLNLVGIQHSGAILPQLHFDVLNIAHIKVPYIVMPRVEQTLKSFVKEKKKKGEFSFELFEKIFDNLLHIIDSIHLLSIIHRDIKPENIFLFERKFVLGDFDIAKFDKDLYTKLIETSPTDRLANYLFSAPEQVKVDTDELTTSADWYAFAQVLYWIITETALRGQSKIQLTHIDSRYSKYESLIANLLSENPQDRFSSKNEILEHLESKKKLSPDQILLEFEDIIFKHMSHLGQSGQGFKKFEDIDSINEIMQDLKNGESRLNYWLSQGYSDLGINRIKKLGLCDRCWLIGYNEVKIKSIWIFKHYYNLGCSCIIIETDNLESSGVYEIKPEYVSEEFGLFNGHYIKRGEVDVGWAEIDGKKVKLNGKAEIRVRILKEDIFFLAPQNGPLVRHDGIIDSIYKSYQEVKALNERLLEPLSGIKKNMGY
ncbi:serine/threonine protein kinase [Sulfuricurvum kujiense DSM 16994]|uniref:Serine/threonine protein kinase n=1 Tax=Sulfuricurvum kujiense (strain ATCC BAA-921 / DSM 16994 / JCM 11577 / YK-1) TaxID=709032 RepID=E4U2B2_SULKY|nr:protein kinase [Sulfuricurvum kujiense]ADR33562.1 serine/threonine protein kinase [Sulfuricurvum kujiense DSM 16994]